MTKPIADDVDTSNEDLVAFTRGLKRVLQSDAGDIGRTAIISVQRENISNAESDLISIKFPDDEVSNLKLEHLTEQTHKRINVISSRRTRP